MTNFWEERGWEINDKHLRELQEMPFVRPFPFIPEKKGLYIIRGPRQVGKTSWLKSILSAKAKSHTCYYLSCETILDHRELREILRSLKGREFVLLDEVNYVKHWELAVKQSIDSGDTHVLIVTGSHSYDLLRGGDRMPGRFDHGGEYTLLPMGLDEFIEARTSAGWSTSDRFAEIVNYFRVGGFPRAVAEGGPNAEKPVRAIQTLWRWLSGDLVRLGRSEDYLKELLLQLVSSMQTPVSFQNLASKTNLSSHNTVKDYVSILESVYALRTLKFINPQTGKYHFKKNRKFYFTDPLLYWMSKDLQGNALHDSDYSAIAEMVAHEELSRRYSRFGYTATNLKGEIDFISPKQWAIEVKWADTARNISKLYLDTPLPFKEVWTKPTFAQSLPPNFS